MSFEPDIKTQDPTSLIVSSEASSKPYLSLCLSATVGNLGRNYGECAEDYVVGKYITFC
jgi:hypothetical protein